MRTREAVALVAAQWVLGLSLALGLLSGHGHLSRTVLSATCEEDQPCWDCATMGNLVCGDELATDDDGSFVGGFN